MVFMEWPSNSIIFMECPNNSMIFMECPNSLGFLWNRRESVALCFLIVTVVLWVAAARLEILPWFTRMEKGATQWDQCLFWTRNFFCAIVHTIQGREWVFPLELASHPSKHYHSTSMWITTKGRLCSPNKLSRLFLPKHIYNSHYGNGVPVMFTS